MLKSNCNSKPEDDDGGEFDSMSRASSPSASLEGGSNPDKSFPKILHEIVSDESSNDCIHWHQGGRQFVIADKEKFSKKILPIYFGSRGATKYTSFTRRLKRWKFVRISKGPRLGAYHHEFFVKDQPELLAKIFYPGPRKPSPSSSKSAISKGKRASKARRRASTGSFVQPVVNVNPSDVVSFSSISEPVKDSIDRERLNISPMPYSQELSSGSPKLLTKDFTNWLSDTTFGVDDHEYNDLLALDLSSPPAGPVSVISDSSITETPVTGLKKSKPFILPRRHSCIASITSSPSYNVPLNDVGDKASGNAQFESMFPSRPISSLNRLVTNNNMVPSAQQQLYENLRESKLQHFVCGSVVNATQQQATPNQLQQLQQETNNRQQIPQQQPQHFVRGSGLSSIAKLASDLEQQQQQHKAEEQTQDQQRAQLSRYLDELDDVFRFSGEVTLEDYLHDT